MKKVSFLILFSYYTIANFAQNCETVLLNEDFSAKNKDLWPEASDTTKTWKVENGRYIWEGLKNLTYFRSNPVDVKTTNNNSVSVTTIHISGINDKGYGIAFGAKDINNLFAFQVAATGHYIVYKIENKIFKELIKWTVSNAVKKETLAENILTIKTEGTNWNFYVNEQLVSTLAAQPFMGYRFGLISTGAQTIAFDNLLIKENSSGQEFVEQELMNENFNNSYSGWPVLSDKLGTSSVANGKYFADNKDTTGSLLSTKSVNMYYKDYSVSLSVSHLGGKENDPFGILFGFKNTDNFFEFSIYADGYFALYKRANSVTTNLIEDTYSPFVKKGNTAANLLTIKKEGNTWRLFINSHFVAACPAEELFGYRFGIIITGVQKAEFDNLVVREFAPVNIPLPNYAKADSGRVLLFENFNCNSLNWPVTVNDSLDWQVTGSKYITEVKSGRTYFGTTSVNFAREPDYTISISANRTRGSSGSSFGLIIGYDDVKNYYGFEISLTGVYCFYKFTNGVYKEYIKWTKSDAVNKNDGSLNVLTIKKDGTDWKLFINNILVNSVPSERITYSGIGVTVSKEQRIAFDNLVAKGYGKYNTRQPGATRPSRN